MKMSGAILLKLLGSIFTISLLVGCSTMNSWVSFFWEDSESQKSLEEQTRWQNFGESINPIGHTTDHYKKGRYFQQKKKYTIAIEEYRNVLRNNPGHIEALNAMGVAYDQLGEYFKAEMAFKAALELNAHREDITNNLGYCYLLQNKMPAAIEMFQQAVKMNETNTTYKNNLGLAYTHNNQYQLALQEFEETRGRDKGFAYLMQVMARDGISNQSQDCRAVAKSLQRPEKSALSRSDISTISDQPSAIRLEKLRNKILQQENAAVVASTVPEPPIATVASTQDTPQSPPLKEPAADDTSSSEPAQDSSPIAQADIEISNGNGVNGMAHLVGNFLTTRSFTVTRLTNADRFTYDTSTIFYCPGYSQDAHAVADQLPGDHALDEVKKLGRSNIKIRVLLGNDVINKRRFFKQSIMTAEAGARTAHNEIAVKEIRHPVL